MSPLLETDYSTEAKAAFDAFKDGGAAPAEKNEDGIKESEFIEKAKFIKIMDEKWKKFLEDFTPEDYFKIYTSGYNREKMYLREFLFM